MTLQILPPELVAPAAGKTTEKKQYDSLELLPNKIESDTYEEVRLLGTFESGHILAPWRCAVEVKQPDGSLRFGGYSYSEDYEGFPDRCRLTDWSKPDRPKIEGEYCKPKRALCAIVWSYERDRIELLIAEQVAIKSQLVEVLSDSDYDFDSDTSIANFVLKIKKQGSGIDTSYSILPKVRKIEAKVKSVFETVRETAKVDALLRGSHPLLQPAQFCSDKDASTEF